MYAPVFVDLVELLVCPILYGFFLVVERSWNSLGVGGFEVELGGSPTQKLALNVQLVLALGGETGAEAHARALFVVWSNKSL